MTTTTINNMFMNVDKKLEFDFNFERPYFSACIHIHLAYVIYALILASVITGIVYIA